MLASPILQRLSILAIIVIAAAGTPVLVQGQTQDPVLAVINGKNISQSEVDAIVTSQLLPLQQQIYALRKSTLDNLVMRAILEGEARKRRISLEELRTQLTVGPVDVSTSQVEQLYQENAGAFAAMSPDEAKERLRLDLESQARMRNYRTAVSVLREGLKIEMRLEEPRLPALTDRSDTPSLGPKDAAITITEFSDFQCPYCRETQNSIKQVLTSYGNDVRLVFKHLPLDIHTQAFVAARAAFCAGEQNTFWKFHDALFASADLSSEGLSKIASNLGLVLDKFNSCLVSESSRTAVLKDLQDAKRLGINSTPTFIINGRLLRGATGLEAFKKIIESELESISAISRPSQPPRGKSSLQERR